MKIAIVGPGAIGILFGTLLGKKNEEVFFLDYNKERVEKIKKEGFVVENQSANKFKANITSNPAEIGKSDLVILAVKSYDTEPAVKLIRPLMGEETMVLTIQNGIGNIQVLVEAFGEERVLGGVTNHGATLLGLGHIKHAGKGETIIGRVDGKIIGAVRVISQIFNKAGIETKITRDVESVIWSKLIINIGINALAAITRLPNGKILEFEGTREILRSSIQEAVKIAKRKRVKLLYDDPIQKVESVARFTCENICSMLQDVLNKKKTEIDFINGAIVRQGKALNIPTPYNEMLTNLVRTIEESYALKLKEN